MSKDNGIITRVLSASPENIPHSTTSTRYALPTCEICGLPGRNAYPASNDRTYDLCDEHLYELLNRINAWYKSRIQTKLKHIRMELQSEVVA